MKVLVNGWFARQLHTGSGQYLAGLSAWLPAATAGRAYEWVLARPQNAAGSPVSVPAGWRELVLTSPFDAASENLAKLWFEQIAFPAACSRLQADLALVPYWGSPLWCPCPIVVTVHDLIPRLLPLYRGGWLQRAYTGLVSASARRANAVLTDSAASRQDLIRHLKIAPGKVRAIHLAVDPAYRPVHDVAELQRVRARYHLPQAPFLLYLGGFDARKNVQRVLEAYAALRGSLGNAGAGIPLLAIAGQLPARHTALTPDPRPLVTRLGLQSAVHFTGWVDEADKPALYTLATAALFVSEYEGFGLPLLEAQACGCPAITSGPA
jgi:glycosyltransferase involved in cell wall biosynthesis